MTLHSTCYCLEISSQNKSLRFFFTYPERRHPHLREHAFHTQHIESSWHGRRNRQPVRIKPFRKSARTSQVSFSFHAARSTVVAHSDNANFVKSKLLFPPLPVLPATEYSKPSGTWLIWYSHSTNNSDRYEPATSITTIAPRISLHRH